MNPMNQVFRTSFMVIASDLTLTRLNLSQVCGIFVGIIGSAEYSLQVIQSVGETIKMFRRRKNIPVVYKISLNSTIFDG